MTPTDPTAAAPRPGPSAGPGEALTPSEALRKARELITPEGAWIRKELARTADGRVLTYGYASDAVCWCSYGAIEAALGHEYTESVDKYLRQAVDPMDGSDFSLVSWNDSAARTHAEVLDAFRRAEQLAISEGR